MPDNPTPRDATPTLAELEGTYWRSVGDMPWLRWRVHNGRLESCSVDHPRGLNSGWSLDPNKATTIEAMVPNAAVPMTPAEIAATWPELAPAAAPYPWADGADLTGGLVEYMTGQTGKAVGVLGDSIIVEYQPGFDRWPAPLESLRPALPPGGWQAGMRARVVSEAAYLADGMDGPPRIGAEGKIDLTADCGGYLTIADERTGMEWGVHPSDLLYLPPAAPVVAGEGTYWRYINTAGLIARVKDGRVEAMFMTGLDSWAVQDLAVTELLDTARFQPYTPRPGEWLTLNEKDRDWIPDPHTRQVENVSGAKIHFTDGMRCGVEACPDPWHPCPPPDTATAKPAKQKRGKWRKRAEAAELEVERLKGERDEACANLEVARRYAALYHSQLRTLATPDPPPAAPATDPACGCPADPEFDAYMSSPEAREDAAGLAEELAAAGPLDPAGYREGQVLGLGETVRVYGADGEKLWQATVTQLLIEPGIKRLTVYARDLQPATGWQQEGE